MTMPLFPKALADWTKVIRLVPKADQSAAYHDRGLVHLAVGSYDLAVADFTEGETNQLLQPRRDEPR